MINQMQGVEMPDAVKWRIHLGQRRYTIAFDVAESTDADGSTSYSWSEATFDAGTPTYGDIASAIIRSHYSDDAMTAIINNHLLGDDDAEHEEEWQEMQQWRAYAKEEAKRLLDAIELA
jgi:hypothetical protein